MVEPTLVERLREQVEIMSAAAADAAVASRPFAVSPDVLRARATEHP